MELSNLDLVMISVLCSAYIADHPMIEGDAKYNAIEDLLNRVMAERETSETAGEKS